MVARAAHCVQNNVPRSSATGAFAQAWRLAQCLLKTGYQLVASSNGTTKTIATSALDNRWGPSFGVVGPTTNAGGSSAVVAAPSANGRATITGLTALVDLDNYANTDKGRYFVDASAGTAHQIIRVLGPTSCIVDSVACAVVPGTGKNWTIQDPSQSVYAGHLDGGGTGTGWILLRGPMVLKCPITPGTGDALLMNENIVQTSTGAQAKLISKSRDGSHLILFPRVRGSGGQFWGFDSAKIQGVVSGVEVTPAASWRAKQLEVCFRKHDGDNGCSIWCNATLLHDSADIAETLAVKAATAAGCTALVAPGAGGTDNGFPAHAAMLFGSDVTSRSVATAALTASNTNIRPGMIMCADAIPDEGIVADGSFHLLMRPNALGTSASAPFVIGMSFAVDETGELFPYVLSGAGQGRTSGGFFSSSGSYQAPAARNTWVALDSPLEEGYVPMISPFSSVSTGGIPGDGLGALTADPVALTYRSGTSSIFQMPGGTWNFPPASSRRMVWSLRGPGQAPWEQAWVRDDYQFIGVNIQGWYLGPWDNSKVLP